MKNLFTNLMRNTAKSSQNTGGGTSRQITARFESAQMKNTSLISGCSAVDVPMLSYGASDEHPMSIRSASDERRWKIGGKQFAKMYKYVAVLLMVFMVGIGNAWGASGDVLFTQNFNSATASAYGYSSGTTTQTHTWNKTSTLEGLVGTGSNLFTSVTSSIKKGDIAINSSIGGGTKFDATGIFQAYSNGDNAGYWSLTRTADFAATAPTALKVSMDIWYLHLASGSNRGIYFAVGDGFADGLVSTSSQANDKVHSGFCILNNSAPAITEYGSTTKIYSTGITESTWLTIVWIINNTGDALEYDNPTGSGTTELANDKFDVWVKTQAGAASTFSKIVSAQAATTAAKDLQNIHIGNHNNSSAKHEFRLDNVVVTDLTPAASCEDAPSNPTGFSAGTITSTGATFTITDDANTNNYEIYYSTSSTAPESSTPATATTTDKSKAVTGLTANTTYYAWVRAVCDASHKSSWEALTGSTFTTLPTYTVTYDDNGKTSGYVPTDATAYESGASVMVKGNTGSLTKTGYVFGGWNTKNDGSGTNYVPDTKFDISANTTLYAQWIEGSEATITYVFTDNSSSAELTLTSATPTGTNNSQISVTTSDISYTTGGISDKGKSETSTCKIAAPTSKSNYVRFSFSIADGYQMRITDMDFKVLTVGSSNYAKQNYEIVVSDGENTYSGTNGGFTNNVMTNLYPTSYGILEGDVTITVYGWNTKAADTYRMQLTNTIKGVITEAESCTSPTIGSQPSDVSICAGGTTTLSVGSITGGETPYSYQWYDSDDNAVSTGSGYTSASFTTPTLNSAASYYCIVTESGGCTTISSPATVSMKTATSATFSDNTLDATIGNSFEITGLTAGGSGTKTYKWYQYSNSSGDNEDELEDEVSDTYTFTPVAAGDYYFKCEVTADCGSVKSSMVTVTATVPTYTITNGSPSNGTIAITDGSSAITSAAKDATVYITATPSTGYSFSSWSIYKTGDAGTTVTPNAATASTYFTMPQYDVTVSATFSLIDYTVTHNAATNGSYTIKVGGGSPFSTNTNANYGQTVTLDASPEDGYAFSSWTVTGVSSGDNIEVDGNNQFVMPAEAVTISASFAELYTVSAGSHTNGSFTITPTSAIAGATVSISATGNTGYEFSSWDVYKTGDSSTKVTLDDDDDSDGSTRSFTMPAYGVTVDATFAVEAYSVTYDGDSPTTGTAPTDNTNYTGDGTETVTVADENSMTKTGYTFRGWSDGTTFFLPGQTFTMPASNVTLTAVWDEITETTYYYGAITITTGALTKSSTGTVQFFTNTSGTIANSTAISITTNTPAVASKYYNSNDLSDTELAKSSNWGGSSGNQYIRGMKFANGKTYTIVLGSNVASAITFYGHGGGSKKLTVGGQEWTSNSTENTHESHTFTKSGDFTGNVSMVCGGDFYGVLVITCTAGSNYTISFENGETEPSGDIDDMPNPIAGVPSGVKVLEPATDPSATGYNFGGWYTNAKCTTKVDWSSNITADKVVYAKWTAKTTTLTFDANTSNHGDGDNGGATATYDATTLSSITHTTPEEGYRRTGYWTEATSGDKILNADGTLVKNTTYTTNEDTPNWKSELSSLTLYAQYEENLYTITYNANGGTCATSSATQASVGDELTLPTPTWSGYTFEGWYSAGSKIEDAGDSYEPAADITLYAKWTDNIDGKVFSFIDHNYGDKFKAFDESGWVTSNQNNKDKTYTNATTGVQFVIDDGTWENKTNAVAALAKNVKGTTSMSIVIPAGYIATVKILYGAYGKGDDYRLTVNGTAQSNPDNKLDDGYTNAQVISNMKEITLENQTGTLTLSVSGNKNNYIGRVAATITGYQTLTYVGGSGSNWNTTANWSPACVPTINHDVVLNVPVEVNIAHAVAKSVKIYNDGNTMTGKLTIQPNKGLEVAGTITLTTDGSNSIATREEDLILESSSAGNATLIFNNSNSDKATVQMYSKAWTDGTQGGGTWNWQYVGIPVTDATRLNDYYGGYMYEWNTTNKAWDDVKNTNATLTAFKAYSVSYPTTSDALHTYVIDGTLAATTNQTIDVAAGQTVQAAANSWTAPIRIYDITSENWSPATIFLYNTGYGTATKATDEKDRYTAGTYLPIPVLSAPYIGENYIAPMQGFLFKNNKSAEDGTITLSYADAVRTDGSQGIVAGPMHAPKRAMSDQSKPTVLKIYVSDEEHEDRLVLLEREDFCRGFDNGWDGEKFQINAVKTVPRIFAINETGGREAVSAIPELENTVIGFRPGTEVVYTISFEYNGDENLYLRDTKTGYETLISNENTYFFYSEGVNEDSRFIIATKSPAITTGVDEVNDGSKVYKILIDDHIYIIRDGKMYDPTGQMIK